MICVQLYCLKIDGGHVQSNWSKRICNPLITILPRGQVGQASSSIRLYFAFWQPMTTSTITTGENKVKKACGVPTVDQEIPDVITLNDKLIEELYLKNSY